MWYNGGDFRYTEKSYQVLFTLYVAIITGPVTRPYMYFIFMSGCPVLVL